jgi:hypothetical protein
MSNEIIKNFNMILESFLTQITPLVGTFYIHKFQLIIKYNSTLPIEKFLVHALPLRDKILNRDETYFSNNDNHTDVVGDDDFIISEILRLQNIYLKLDETSRSNLWDIFQAMLILGEDYIRLKVTKIYKK